MERLSEMRVPFRSKIFFLLLTACCSAAPASPPTPEIRLVLQITVDQLRGDLLNRYQSKFGAGGFRRLRERSVYYSNAHYEAANTVTGSGHAVLATGADTNQHGIVANEWWDRPIGKLIYCTADARYPVLDSADSAGQSPVNLTASTIGDEIVRAGLGRAFAVAGKDRSSIIPGGHRGKAFWWAEKTGGFVSSTYYYRELPEWVRTWNATNPAAPFRQLEWKPLYPPATYAYQSAASNLLAHPDATLGRSFPHPLIAKSDALFFAAFRFTPFLDAVTGSFVGELLAREDLGKVGQTDYLSISFSANDYIGHAYGPNSMEAEDGLLRLDTVLSDLLAQIDQSIGLDHVMIVLSADHGVDDIPEAHLAAGEASGRVQPSKLLADANQFLRHRFNVDVDVIAAFVPPGFYLDQSKIDSGKLEPSLVESALTEFLRHISGVAQAITRDDLLAGRVTRTSIGDKVQRAFHPTRSGDVVIVQDQFWYLYPNPEAYAAMHGSPYAYDTFVPILFSVPGGVTTISTEAVAPAQIAPTIALLLGIPAPSGAINFTPLPNLPRVK